MTLFISLVVFAISLYLFIVTNYKIRSIRENILIEDVRKEMESLITEFNGAASRNIEMMEDTITRMQEQLRRANDRMSLLDERAARAGMPVVVERIVERAAPKESPRDEVKTAPKIEVRPAKHANTSPSEPLLLDVEPVKPVREKKKPRRPADTEKALDSFLENTIQANSKSEEEELLTLADNVPDADPANAEAPVPPALGGEKVEETRSERLKALLREGRKKDDLVAMGFLENEINLMSFLVRK